MTTDKRTMNDPIPGPMSKANEYTLEELRNYSRRARAASVFVDPPEALTDTLDRLDWLIDRAEDTKTEDEAGEK